MRHLQLTVLLAGFWLVLTASLRPVDLVLGLIVCVAVGHWATVRLWSDMEPPVLTVRQAVRLVGYGTWLIGEIVKAAILVAERVLDPRMPIAPVVIRYRTGFGRDVSRVTLANSITLTPGTLTVDVDDGVFVVHSLSEEFTEGVVDGTFERRIARVFEE